CSGKPGSDSASRSSCWGVDPRGSPRVDSTPKGQGECMNDVLLPGVTTAGVQTAAHRRRPLDAYFTPAGYTRALLHTLPWVREDLRAHDVIEPCVGTGNIVTALTREGIRVLVTNDLDVRYAADYHLDATLPSTWTLLGHPDWIVTNPPYNVADTLVPLAYEQATRGIAM